VWSVSKSGVEPLAVADLVAFGLVLHSANINEVSRFKNADARWTAVHNGASIVFLILYALILFTTILPEQQLDARSLLRSTVALCVVSFILSLAVFLRLQTEGDQA
jgi:hypothetical protein